MGSDRFDLHRFAAVAATELRILRTDRGILIPIVSPWVGIFFLEPIYRLYLGSLGEDPAVAAQLGASAVAVMWLYFLLGHVGSSFFREYVWLTWDRLRVSGARPAEIILGKTAPLVLIGILHQLSAFLVAGLIFDMRAPAKPWLLLLAIVTYTILVTFMGVALVAVCKTMRRILIVQSIAIMLFGGLGGSLTPLPLLPVWSRAAARLVPNYWALLLYRDGLGVDPAPNATVVWLVLLLFCAAFLLIALRWFRFARRSPTWV